MSIKNALSIDLEDWYHPEFVRNHIRFTPKPQIVDSTKNTPHECSNDKYCPVTLVII